MTPSYLQNQLEQSLRKHDLACVDVYLPSTIPSRSLAMFPMKNSILVCERAFESLEKRRSEGQFEVLWCCHLERIPRALGIQWLSFTRAGGGPRA